MAGTYRFTSSFLPYPYIGENGSVPLTITTIANSTLPPGVVDITSVVKGAVVGGFENSYLVNANLPDQPGLTLSLIARIVYSNTGPFFGPCGPYFGQKSITKNAATDFLQPPFIDCNPYTLVFNTPCVVINGPPIYIYWTATYTV